MAAATATTGAIRVAIFSAFLPVLTVGIGGAVLTAEATILVKATALDIDLADTFGVLFGAPFVTIFIGVFGDALVAALTACFLGIGLDTALTSGFLTRDVALGADLAEVLGATFAAVLEAAFSGTLAFAGTTALPPDFTVFKGFAGALTEVLTETFELNLADILPVNLDADFALLAGLLMVAGFAFTACLL